MSALAFDAGGNLWVGGLTGGPLQPFAASDLPGSGMISPTPLATIAPVTVKHRYCSFSQTGGLAIEDQGNLWVSSLLGDGEKLRGNISEFTAAQIGERKPATESLSEIRYPDPPSRPDGVRPAAITSIATSARLSRDAGRTCVLD